MRLPIDKDIARASVEIVARLHVACRKHGDVSDAPDILHGAVQRRMGRAEPVERHEQRAALPTQRDVSHAKGRNGRDARLGRNDGNLGHVDVRPDLVPFEELW